jgi:demethylmenaquinone methyltransferase/2-methoxy-6-polyprenyl-1,4-benzoquinol methylase
MVKDKYNDKISFGFRDVAAGERQKLVNTVFSKVAGRYDLMNDLMSGGMHRLWKSALVGKLAPPTGSQGFKLLDVAGGTADIAMRVLTKAGEGTAAIVYDISREMLTEGRQKVCNSNYSERMGFVQGNAEKLPFADCHFDAYTIAFGIRNVTNIDAALAEAYRVLRPGGRFMCLEFSEMQIPVLDKLYDAFSFNAIPLMGKLVAGDAQPYEYLVESIRKFPTQERFLEMLNRTGFENSKYSNLSGGIAAIHSGWRI